VSNFLRGLEVLTFIEHHQHDHGNLINNILDFMLIPKHLCYTQGTNVKEIKMKQALQKFEQLVTMLFKKIHWWLDDIFTC
jgi:hypothetical protein